MAQVERVLGTRVSMDADHQYLRALIEDALSTVALVVVHVQHRHAAAATAQQGLGGHSRIVDEAIAAHEIGACMVPGRPRDAEDTSHAPRQQPGGTGRRIGPGLGSGPGSGRDGTAVVHRIQPQAGGEVSRFQVTAQRAHRPYRRERLTLAVAGVQLKPLSPGRFKKCQIARAVYQGQHSVAVVLWDANLVTARQQGLDHKPCAGGRFKTRNALAAEELVLGRVGLMRGREENQHGNSIELDLQALFSQSSRYDAFTLGVIAVP